MDLTGAAVRYTLKRDRYSSHSQIAAWLRRYQAQVLHGRACVVLKETTDATSK